MNGSSSSARVIALNLKFWFITSAIPSPPMAFRMVAAPVNLTVLPTDCQKIGSFASVTKLPSPHERGGPGHLAPEEAQIHAVEERVAEKQQEKQDRRREDEPAEHGLPLHEFAEPAEPQRPVVARFERVGP